MNEQLLENLIKQDIESIFTQILIKHNYIFPISAKSRSGAEISDYLEDGFVEYITKIHTKESIILKVLLRAPLKIHMTFALITNIQSQDLMT